MIEFRYVRSTLFIFSVFACGVINALAADYPDRPVRLIVGYGAGGGTDIMARLTARKLTEKWAQSVIVENRAGADGTIAYDAVARSKPDGYTLAYMSNDFTVAPSLHKLNYDPMKDFVHVSLTASTPDILLVNASVPVNSLQELIAFAKANPRKLNFGSSGPGSGPFLLMVRLNQATGMSMVHVPYSGTGPAMTALLGGVVNLLFSAVASAVPPMQTGKVKALAITSRTRFYLTPDIPTVAEVANLPDYEGGVYYGVLAPAGTANEIVAKLYADMSVVLKQPDAQKSMNDLGFVLVGNSPAEFRKQIADDIVMWANLLKTVDLK